MRKSLITLLGISSLLFTGCSSIKNENAIYAFNSYEKEVIELKAQSVENMINENYSFSLLMYTEQCSYCTKAKENLSKVTSELGFASYQIEMYSGSINYLSEKLSDYYSTSDSYPSLYIINKGQLSYKSQPGDLTNYSNLKKLIKSYSIKTNTTILTTLESYNEYKVANKEFMLFTYDSSLKDEQKVYSYFLYPMSAKSSKNLLIIDKMTAKTELISKIYEDYSISFNDTFDVLSTTFDGQIKTTLRYTSESGSSINDLVKSYFNIDSVISTSKG